MENHIRQGGLVGDTLKRQSHRAFRPWVSLTLKGEEVSLRRKRKMKRKGNRKIKSEQATLVEL